MTEKERRARCAWLCWLGEQAEGIASKNSESYEEVRRTVEAMVPFEKMEHFGWREYVHNAMERTLQRFCPSGDCCDAASWGPEARLAILRLHKDPPEISPRDMGLLESIGRALRDLPPKERVRLLIASLALQSVEAHADPDDTAETARLALVRYQARFDEVAEGQRDGKPLLAYAFPELP